MKIMQTVTIIVLVVLSAVSETFAMKSKKRFKNAIQLVDYTIRCGTGALNGRKLLIGPIVRSIESVRL